MLRTVSGTFFKFPTTLKGFIVPALAGFNPPGALQCSLLTLLTRFGGMGIVTPNSLSQTEFSTSMYVTIPL